MQYSKERKLFEYGYEIHDGFVWRDSMAITYLDPGTFKVHTATLVEDKNGICKLYYGERKPMLGVDPASYREWEHNIAMDKNTLEILDRNYIKDKHHVIYRGHFISNADPKTFRVMEEGWYYSRDNKAVYYKGNKLANADPNTFEVIDPIFVKDRDKVFRNGEEIISAQPNSFT